MTEPVQAPEQAPAQLSSKVKHYYTPDEVQTIFSHCSLPFLKLCQSSFKFFAEHMFGLTLDEPHIESVEVLETYNLVLAEMHRGAGKSLLYSKIYPLWKHLGTIDLDNLLTRPFLRSLDILTVSASQDQSSAILEEIKGITLSNPVLRILLLPQKLSDTKWSAEEIIFRNGNKMKAKPLTPTARGFHGHIVIVDDLLKDTDNKNIEESLIKRFYSIIFPTIFAKHGADSIGQMLVVGTPQSDTDLLRRLEKHEQEDGTPLFKHLRYPAVIVDDENKWVRPLVPSRYSLSKLKMIQSTMPPDTWAREYMLVPIDESNSYFNMEIVRQQITPSPPKPVLDRDCRYYLGLDVALSDSATADFTVFTVLEERNGEYYLVNIVRQKGMEEDEIIAMLNSLDARFHFSMILIEQAPISYGLCARIEREVFLSNIEFYVPTEQRRTELLSGLRTALEVGNLWLPNHEVLVDELRKFKRARDSRGKYKVMGVGAHDDIVLSLAMAVSASRLDTFVVGGENIDDDVAEHIIDVEFDEAELAEIRKELHDEEMKRLFLPEYAE